MNREIFLMAGEASGDARGAELIRALKARDPSLSFSGMGGPKMHEAGMEILADVSDLAVVGIVEVLKHYALFKRTMDQLLLEIQRRQPAVVIGVDYPGFNLRLLRKVRDLHSASKTKIKTVQYVSPQLWAWDERRKWAMANYLDLVLCIFPFEPEVYDGTGLKAVFVGHPLSQSAVYEESGRDPNLAGLFPGSRERELHFHMPVFAELEENLKRSHPRLQCAYACTNDRMASIIKSYSAQARIEKPEHLHRAANVGVVCSGTATLEAALSGLPMCVVYRVAWPTYWMGRLLIKVPFLAMPNLLAGTAIVREFIQSECTASNLAAEVDRLLNDPATRKTILSGYRQIRGKLGRGKAAENAADEILKLLA